MGVLGHGFRCRLGLTPDRFGRQVLEFAALPGLAIASTLAAFLFIWGEWIPRHAVPPLGPHFGRFVTVAPIACLVWVLCFTYAIGAPQHRRAAAALAVGSIGAAVVVGKLVGLSPNIAQMGILIGLGLPGVLASTDRPSSRQVAGSLGAGLIAFGVLWWLGVTPGSRFVSFYWYGNWAFTRDLVLVALATFVGAVGLAASGRRVLAWAVVLLASPFVLSPVHVIKSFRSSWMPHWVTTQSVVHGSDHGLRAPGTCCPLASRSARFRPGRQNRRIHGNVARVGTNPEYWAIPATEAMVVGEFS